MKKPIACVDCGKEGKIRPDLTLPPGWSHDEEGGILCRECSTLQAIFNPQEIQKIFNESEES